MNTGYHNYDKYPFIKAQGKAYSGYESIKALINRSNERIIVLDCYPVVDVKSIVNGIGELFDEIFYTDTCAYCGDELTEKMQKNLTDDRIFGVMTTDCLTDYFIDSKIAEMQSRIRNADGRVLVIGVGAMLVWKSSFNVHCSVARWESQLRFRKGAPNWNCDNYDMDPLTKFKRGYFVEWRIADKHKIEHHEQFHYFMDTNSLDCPKLISRSDYDNALEKAVNTPFRVVPYFDPGVWGGQWMKEVCGLDKTKNNFAWCFDCVPEENSVFYDFDNVKVEMPALDIVLLKGKELLGERVQARYGNEFPIRFDFLDTMDGGNLSLQVHPTTQYIQEKFNMRYTQDESYYILDSGENSCVYLGAKEDVKPAEFIGALHKAQETGEINVERYVNKWPAKKHDHFLIPGGTLHCSGRNAMVLEISSTPYIFTFKLWDWGRLGLDGKPRPINIEHGSKVINYSRDTKWVKENLIDKFEPLEKTNTYSAEKTGLHIFEPIETVRHWFTDAVLHKANGSVCVLNLVEGEEAEVISPNDSFEPYVVHYAETFIVPSNVGDFIVRPTGKTKGNKLATIKATIR
ncbi:MAG: class I mannose-6-phosphate isomerase [Acutalibacteraceae bacterium]